MEILFKDVRSTVLNVFHELKETMDRELKEIGKRMYEQNEDMNKQSDCKKGTKAWKQPKCPSVDDLIDKPWLIQTTEFIQH